MAESKSSTSTDGVAKVAGVEAPHDRVVSLSLRSDGTPDQTNPEIIGDKETALELTKKQFAEYAVSAADQKLREEQGLAGTTTDEPGADKQIDALKAEHDKVAAAAEKQAEAVVNSLHKG